MLSTSMFIASTAVVEDLTEPPLELNTSPYSHHFSALDKPKSFEMYDDTSLLATDCHHGIPVMGDLLRIVTRTSEISLTIALASTLAKNYINSEQH